MPRETAVVLNITSEIGHMMADASYCPPSATQTDILEFFKTLILEQESSYTLKNSDLDAMKRDIDDYFNGVTTDKNSLIAEESAEAAADLVVAAASIAAAAGSWIPFVNFGLAAAVIAATAIAMGLEIASEKLEKTVVEEISKADSNIITKYDSFKLLETYSSAVTSNAAFYPRLQLGATIKQMRALFLGVIITIKKANQGKCTEEDMRKTFVDYYNATQADPTLVARFTEIMEELDQGGDPEKFKEDIAAFFKPLPDAVVKGYAGLMLAFSASIAIRQGRVAYQAYKAAQVAAAEVNIELDELDENGEVVSESGAPAAEAEILTTAEIAVRSMAVLAAVAAVVFAGLEIAKAVDTDKKLTQAIADAKSGIKTYYTSIVNRTIDGESIGVDVIGIGTGNDLWTRTNLNSQWMNIANSGSVIGVTVMQDGTILGIGMGNDLYTRKTLSSPWINVPNSGSVIGVTVMQDGTILGIGMGNDLWTRKTLDSQWINVPNSGSVIGVTVMQDGTILGIGLDHLLYTRKTLSSPWVNIPNSGSVIGVTRGGVHA